MQDQRPRLEDFTIKRVALGLPPEIAEVTGRSERSGPDTYPIRDLNQLSRPHAVNQWVTRSPRNDTPPPRWGRILYARYGGSAAGPAEMPERKCDHLNWPRFGLLSSRISARLVVISPDGWAAWSGIAAPPPDLIVTSSLSAWRSGMARSCVELFEQIRRNWRAAGSSIQELAVRHHVHRWTVRQALASAVPPRKAYPPRPRPADRPVRGHHRRVAAGGPGRAPQAAAHGPPDLAAAGRRARRELGHIQASA